MDSTKTFLRSLLTASPTAMTLQQVSKEYRNTIGESIPYTKFGFTSLEQFFRSIPDTVQLQGTGPFAVVNLVVSEKSSHVLELVSRQKVEKKKGLRYPMMKRTVVSSTKNVFKNYTPTETRPQSQKIVYPTSKPFNSSTTNTVSTYNLNKDKFKSTFTHLDNLNETQTTESKGATFQCSSKSPINQTHITPPQEQKLNAFVENVRDSKYENSIEKMIENMNISNNVSPNIQRLNQSHMSGYSNQVKATADHCTSSRSESRASSNTSNKLKDDVSQSEELVPVTVRSNLKKLIEKFPDGIWCAELPSVYRKMFKREIKYHDLGFRSLIDLCTYLKSIFHYVRPSTDDFKLYDRSKPLPKTAEQEFTAASYSSNKSLPLANESASALPNIDWSDILLFIPSGVFKPGQEIPRIFIPETTQEDETMEIVIGEVFDVSKFWVYKDDGQLDKLMDELQTYYTEHADEYRVPQHLIREGLYCVCIIFGEYHRALVVNAVCEGTDEIRVFYIDYGTIKRQKPELFFLHEHFAKLPAQTIRCRLANICPPEKGAPWTRECTEEFKALIKRRDLTAKINRINWKDQYIEISLADVTDPQNVFYINNVLVERGHAIFIHQEQKTSIIDSICTPIVNFIHLFPTFMELEHGLAPSTSEMETYASCNVPINFCYPQYFSFDHSEEEKIIDSVTDFYETRILKGLRPEVHRNFSVDVSRIEEKPIDFSYFMDLEDKMKDYWASCNTEEDVEEAKASSIDTTEKDENIVMNISKKIEMWKNETVTELKRDCELSEDIMKDILNICQLNTGSELGDKNLDLSAEYNESLNLKQSEYLYTEINCSEYDEESASNRPYNELSFSRNSSLESSIFSDNYPPFTADSPENLIPNDDSENACKSEDIPQGVGDKIALHPTNPFLNNLIEDKDDTNDIVGNNGRLFPTNPFLQYMADTKEEECDKRSDSSTSTSYETCSEKVQKTPWSNIDHRVFDYVPEQFCSPPTTPPSSVSIKEIEDDDADNSETATVSTTIQTNCSPSPPLSSNVKSCSVQTGTVFDVNQPEFYPSNYYPAPYPVPMPVPHYFPYPFVPTAHPAFYSNPYYAQQMNKQLLMASALLQKGTIPAAPATRMAICPPPGFASDSNVFAPQNSTPDFYEAHNEMLKSRFNS